MSNYENGFSTLEPCYMVNFCLFSMSARFVDEVWWRQGGRWWKVDTYIRCWETMKKCVLYLMKWSKLTLSWC